MLIRQIGIRNRLLSGFTLTTLLVLILGLFSLNSMSSMRQVAGVIEGNVIPSLNTLSNLNLNMMRIRVFTLRLLAAEDARAIGFDEGPVFEQSYQYLENAGMEVVRQFKRSDAKAVLDYYKNSGGRIYNGRD
mgnify:CR=1 FL=1